MRCRLVLLGLALLGLSMGCSIKSQFIQLAYPDTTERTPPERDWALSLTATVVPLLTIGYDNPQAVGQCLADLAPAAEALWTYGQCLADRGNSEFDCGHKYIWKLVWSEESLAQTSPMLLCDTPVDPADQLRMAWALADVGEALYSYNVSIIGNWSENATFDSRIREAVPPALSVAIRTLTAHHQVLRSRHTDAEASRSRVGSLPALSLSGAAANGAFTGGYLYALLLAREAAISNALQQRDTKTLIHIERSERFEAVVGTSAGSLAAVLVDLYFSDNADITPRIREALNSCPDMGSVPYVDETRLVQACALGWLRTGFIQNEWDLMCVVDGAIFDLFANTTGVLRFDPLSNRMLQPFFANFGELMLENDFLRVAMAVDLQQNVLVGLDERVCRWSEIQEQKKQTSCLTAAVLASIVEPVFAEPVPRVFLGLNGGDGEDGTWIDGGLRSGVPAARAVLLTRVNTVAKGMDASQPKVLAINTHRAEGIVSRAPSHAISVLFNSFSSLIEQTRQWEMAYAQRLDPRRRERLCLLEQQLNMSPLFCSRNLGPIVEGEAMPRAFPQLGIDDVILPIFVPDDIDPPQLFAEGYTFDPKIMWGLFLWGQRMFFANYQHVLQWLGWLKIAELAQPNLEEMKKSVAEDLHNLQTEIAAPDWWQQRREARRRDLKRELKLCD